MAGENLAIQILWYTLELWVIFTETGILDICENGAIELFCSHIKSQAGKQGSLCQERLCDLEPNKLVITAVLVRA